VPTIMTEFYDVLRELGASDEKARAAAAVQNDSRQLQLLIQTRLAPLEKDLKRIKWRVTAIFFAAPRRRRSGCFFLSGRPKVFRERSVDGKPLKSITAIVSVHMIVLGRCNHGRAACEMS
jgi:hypothetical protein